LNEEKWKLEITHLLKAGEVNRAKLKQISEICGEFVVLVIN
jgi:hypothetical protein